MPGILLLASAQVDAVGRGGVLTLVFPLVLVFIIAAMWVAWWMRRSRNYP